MNLKYKLIFGILLLLGVISCSNVENQNFNIKIVDIPEGISSIEFDNTLSILIQELTLEKLFINKDSLLDELYYESGKLICTLKPELSFHNGVALSTKQIIKNLHCDLDINILSDKSFEIKYTNENKEELEDFLNTPLRFYPESLIDEPDQFYIGSGKYSFNSKKSNSVTLNKFNAHPNSKNVKYKRLKIFWNQDEHFDTKIKFQDIVNGNLNLCLYGLL